VPFQTVITELIEEIDYPSGALQKTWLKTLAESNPSEEKYQILIQGKMILLMPATITVESTILDVDENWSATGGGYTRDAENRFDKTYIDYKPEITNQEIKLQLSLINPLAYTEIQKQNKVELD